MVCGMINFGMPNCKTLRWVDPPKFYILPTNLHRGKIQAEKFKNSQLITFRKFTGGENWENNRSSWMQDVELLVQRKQFDVAIFLGGVFCRFVC